VKRDRRTALGMPSATFPQFEHLLRTGEPRDGRKLGLMSTVAQRAFVHFKDAEIAALYAYLRTL
jgi:hypothetical protein